MIKAHLLFVPAGGGELDYSLSFNLPSVAQAGDYISISRPEHDGTIDFIVRRTWWHLDYPNNNAYDSAANPTFGTCSSVCVECEFAVGLNSTKDHRASAEGYARKKGKATPTFDISTY